MIYLIDPYTLVDNSKEITGFTDMVNKYKIPQWVLLEIAYEVAEYWTGVSNEGQGFGSSDTTHLIKDFIDNIIYRITDAKMVTKFNPLLSVVESEL